MREIKGDFPFFENNPDVVWLDNASTTQLPARVIDRMTRFLSCENANVGRGEYPTALKATLEFERARDRVARFFGCGKEDIAFTFNATDALNAAAEIVGGDVLKAGENVITTFLEHNSSVLPWMRLCEKTGAEMRFIPMKNGVPDVDKAKDIIDKNTRAAVITAGSNVTGWRAPLKQICDIFAKRDVPLIIDASQAAPHETIDVSTLSFDYMCFSAHKMYAPTGVGVLIAGKKERREGVYRLGGGTVKFVEEGSFERISGARGLEAGTQNAAAVTAFAEALDYLSDSDINDAWENECKTADIIREGLKNTNGINVLYGGENPLPVVAFTTEFISASDAARLLGAEGIAVRAGKHCAHIAHKTLGVESTLRASAGIYNTPDDAYALIEKIRFLRGKYGKR